jgi:hypothetical protein
VEAQYALLEASREVSAPKPDKSKFLDRINKAKDVLKDVEHESGGYHFDLISSMFTIQMEFMAGTDPPILRNLRQCSFLVTNRIENLPRS